MTNSKHRHSIRVPGFDYSSPGAYFITPCTWHREFTFEIRGAHEAVLSAWHGLLEIFGGIELDEFIIMPNHVHGIIWILDGGAHRMRRGEQLLAQSMEGRQLPAPTKWIALGHIVGAFKTMAASAINRLRENIGTTVWQRNYYEHIIRNHRELKAIRQYIRNNPLKWELDIDNPKNWSKCLPPKTKDDYLRNAGVL